MEHLFNCHGEWTLAGPIAGCALYVKHWITMRLQK